MKVTLNLIEYISAYIQAHGSSYSDIGKRAGMSWQNVQKIMHGNRLELRDASVTGLAHAMGLDEDSLRRIANGESISVNADHDDVARKAAALWRWVNHDPNRSIALRAMGYKGALPKTAPPPPGRAR